MFKIDLFKNIKDDNDIDEDIKIYISFLLFSCFFLEIHNNKEIEKIVEQLINMRKSNDILVKRIRFSKLTVKMNDMTKEKKYYDFFKILFLENCGDESILGEFLFVLIDYISEYQSFDINISKNVNLLYKK